MSTLVNYVGIDDMVQINISNDKYVQVDKNNGKTYRHMDLHYCIDDEHNIVYFDRNYKNLFRQNTGESVLQLISFEGYTVKANILYVLYSNGNVYRYTRHDKQCSSEKLIITDAVSMSKYRKKLYIVIRNGSILELEATSHDLSLKYFFCPTVAKKVLFVDSNISPLEICMVLLILDDKGDLWCYCTNNSYRNMFEIIAEGSILDRPLWRQCPNIYSKLRNIYVDSTTIFLLYNNGDFHCRRIMSNDLIPSIQSVDLQVTEMITYPCTLVLTSNHNLYLFGGEVSDSPVFYKQDLPLCKHIDLMTHDKRFRNTKCAK